MSVPLREAHQRTLATDSRVNSGRSHGNVRGEIHGRAQPSTAARQKNPTHDRGGWVIDAVTGIQSDGNSE
jgi:hypothetical protein